MKIEGNGSSKVGKLSHTNTAPLGPAEEAELVACSLDTLAFAQNEFPMAAARLARLDLDDPSVNDFISNALKRFVTERSGSRRAIERQK